MPNYVNIFHNQYINERITENNNSEYKKEIINFIKLNKGYFQLIKINISFEKMIQIS